MKIILLKLLSIFILLFFNFQAIAKEALSGTGLSGRVNFGLGYGYATNEFERKHNYAGFAAHLDLQAELRPLIIGVTTMGLIKANSNSGDASAMGGLYLGYGIGKNLDIVMGPAFGFLNMVRKGELAAPDDEVRRQSKAAGAFMGVRAYLVGRLGLSLSGYYMKSSDYDETRKLSTTETKTSVNQNGYTSAVLVSLFVATGPAASAGETKSGGGWGWSFW